MFAPFYINVSTATPVHIAIATNATAHDTNTVNAVLVVTPL